MSSGLAVALDPVTALRELLRVPSVTGDVDEAAVLLVRLAAGAGFEARRDGAGNVVMSWGADARGGDIVLLGHLDTVPGALPVREEAGRLHGRGAVDAKGPLAAALAAVSRLPRDGGRGVTVIAACDEEGPSLGARALRARPAPASLIVLEPSGWDTVTTGYRGCVRLGVEVAQPSAHHAAPAPGAADRLVALLGELRAALPAPAARAVDSVQLRVNDLAVHDDGCAQRASAALEARIPAGTTVDEIVAQVHDIAAGARITVESACEPASVPRGNPVARALVRGIHAAGGRPRYTTKTGTSDLNVVLPAWRCAAAVYGPGDCSLDHGPNESIDVEELRRGAGILESALRALR